MKNHALTPTRTLVASLALSATVVTAAALAAPITDPRALVQSAVGGEGQVSVSIDADGVATLTGYVATASTRRIAEAAVLKGEGVREVINLISDD